jgi:hypothetical protein
VVPGTKLGPLQHGVPDSARRAPKATTAPKATANHVKVVQRFPVRIRLNKDQDRERTLRPGMSVVESAIANRRRAPLRGPLPRRFGFEAPAALQPWFRMWVLDEFKPRTSIWGSFGLRSEARTARSLPPTGGFHGFGLPLDKIST